MLYQSINSFDHRSYFFHWSWVRYSPMAWETGVQSQVELYQRLKKWYLIPPFLTLDYGRQLSLSKWFSLFLLVINRSSSVFGAFSKTLFLTGFRSELFDGHVTYVICIFLKKPFNFLFLRDKMNYHLEKLLPHYQTKFFIDVVGKLSRISMHTGAFIV